MVCFWVKIRLSCCYPNCYGKLTVNWGEIYHFSIYLVINSNGVTCCILLYSLINVIQKLIFSPEYILWTIYFHAYFQTYHITQSTYILYIFYMKKIVCNTKCPIKHYIIHIPTGLKELNMLDCWSIMALFSGQNYFYCIFINFGCFTLL